MTILLYLTCSFNVQAHEFWIEPLSYQIAPAQIIQAEVRSGEHFSGESYPYMPDRIVAATVHGAGKRSAISGIAGSFPAIQVRGGTGLHIISYQSTVSELAYKTFAEFEHFLREDGLTWVETAHRKRGLKQRGLKESFTRYTKALVAVGNGKGWDKVVGLPYEMVALNNPYDSDHTGGITIQLLRRGRPVAHSQVTVFQKESGASVDTTPLKLSTNINGQVIVPRGGGGQFLVSSVIMTEGETTPWHSHWASITYFVQ